MHSIFSPRRKSKESGFTLIEILVVILIIGILASIAVPVFLNQRKKSVEAGMKSDLKNAASAMEQEMTQNGGKYPSSIPIYDKQSANNQIFLDSTKSSANSYCLQARNTSYAELKFSYSSMEGGLLADGAACSASAVSGPTNIVAIADKKALVVDSQGGASNANAGLSAAGITKVDHIPNGTLTLAKAQTYDIVVLVGSAWAPNGNDVNVAKTYYAGGGKVFTDGNDGNSWNVPMIASSVARQSDSTNFMKVEVNPTYNEGLSPSFPYTFKASSFDSRDTWQCAKTATSGTVIIADSVDPQAPAERCLTMLGQSSGQGRWLHIAMFAYPEDYATPETNSTVAGFKWLAQ
jgi:prepilin-type N-terminal cleavage/methylation domain-containing protein